MYVILSIQTENSVQQAVISIRPGQKISPSLYKDAMVVKPKNRPGPAR